MRNLCGEMPGLTLVHSEKALLLFHAYFYGPSHGVDFECHLEVQFHIGGKVRTPLVILVPSCEEKSYRLPIQRYVSHHVRISKHPMMLVLSLPEFGSKRVCGEQPFAVAVPCLRHLYHTQVVLAVEASDKVGDVRAGEPAVAKDVLETDLVLDTSLYHLLHQLYLAHDTLLFPTGNLIVLAVSSLVLSCRLPAVESIIGILVLPAEGKIHQQLADAVREATEKTLVAPMSAVRHMREYLARHLYCVAGFDDVRVVEYEHRGKAALLEVVPYGYLCPKLAVDVVHDPAPFRPSVVQEIVEHVLVAIHKFEKRRVHVMGWIGYGKHWEHQQQLEDAQCRVETIGLRLLKTERTQIKFYILQHTRYCYDCTIFVIFSEKRCDFRENFCTFAHGLKCFV